MIFRIKLQLVCSILCYFSLELSAQTNVSSNRDVNESTFDILDTLNGFKYKTVENNYKIVNINSNNKSSNGYLAKFKTTTIKNLSEEEQERTIEVRICPLNNVNKTSISIRQSCDELRLDYDYYKTWKYGCCLRPTYVNLYNYNNDLIISGSDKVYTGSFPHSDLNLYFTYKAPLYDSTSLGSINISYNEKEQYHVFLKGKVKNVWEEGGWLDICPTLYPNIEIESAIKYSYDEDNITYKFSTMDKIKTVSEINFNMIFKFDCDVSILPIKIPIINGKPFGKDEKNQTYEVKHN